MGRLALNPARLGTEGAVFGAGPAFGVEDDAETDPPAEMALPGLGRLRQPGPQPRPLHPKNLLPIGIIHPPHPVLKSPPGSNCKPLVFKRLTNKT